MGSSRKLRPKEKEVTSEVIEESFSLLQNKDTPSSSTNHGPELQFVTNRVPGQKDENPELRTLVRRYAMHAFLREKNSGSSHSNLKITWQNSVEVTLEKSVGKFRLGSLPERARRKRVATPRKHPKLAPANERPKADSNESTILEARDDGNSVAHNESSYSDLFPWYDLDNQDIDIQFINPDEIVDIGSLQWEPTVKQPQEISGAGEDPFSQTVLPLNSRRWEFIRHCTYSPHKLSY